MSRKIYLDNEFYLQPMVTQKDLSRHWSISEAKITELVTKGTIKKNKLNKISMKHVMELEELGVDEIEHINIRSIMKENNSLKSELEQARKMINEFKIATETILQI